MTGGGQLVGITECNVNFFRLILLLVNGGKDVLNRLFITRMTPNTTVDSFLQSYRPTLTTLKNKKKILPSQWSQLFPVAKPDEWDISLWCLLLGNICGICPPRDWNSQPSAADVSPEADLVRLRLFRNNICHVAEAESDKVNFQAVWKDVSTVLLRLTDHDQQYQKTLEKTIETYKEGPLPNSSDQKVLLLEVKKWQCKEGMEEVNDIKLVLSEFMDMVAQLESKLFFPLLDTCDRIAKKMEGLPTTEQVDRKMERYGAKWNSKITGIIKDLEKMVKSCGSEFKRNVKNMCQVGITADARYANVKIRLASISKLIKGFKINHVDNMKILFEMMECQVKLTHTSLANQKIMMINQKQIRQQQNEDHSETRGMLQDIIDYMTCVKIEKGDTPDKGKERQKSCAGGACIAMSCGHRFEKDDLDDYLQHLLHLGHTSLTCYKEACRTEWCLSELRTKLQWTDKKNMTYEETLNRNYFAKADIKECPSCRSFCTRRDERNIRVRCILCRRFEFCWGCGQTRFIDPVEG
ncbi:uncharacterized protein LOC110452836 [Mizuhopecten yessoensis]|uniref:E3 ubiquitin-protein ligase DZIP3 n=1 Tax=Mizuhopecten yessoensis TaxID=6573 RepID=A0A210QIV0_MIZYE|nr:uncharacterized protein LOC110452836 [Mizuhopecten yessoensis]OWF48616.1 E3 ubiquitin-protein ligase DZIP3 [Mizuhopecten yessoensis]